MQAVFNVVTLLSLIKLGAIQAVPVGVREVDRRDVDLLDPSILREDVDDLRWASENGDERLYSLINTNVEALQTKIDALDATVRSLQERVVELERWRAESETQQRSMGQEMREGLQQVTANLHVVNNHAMSLDDVVLQHHPENYRQLGYTLNEDASGVEDTSSPTEETREESSNTPITEGSASPVVLSL